MTQSTHFIGIGGTGLSAIARVLVERGEHVSGSDREPSPLAESLRQLGVAVTYGHAAANINGATRVLRSSAVTEDNVEVQAALTKGLPVYRRAEFLGEMLADQQLIAVAGSHGKTTTTAMVAWMLSALNQKPGYILGSVAQNLGANAAAGAGRLFVIEADEYDYMFLGLKPKIALVTNVEHDHPDLFPTEGEFKEAFRRFVDGTQPGGTLIACADDAGALQLLSYAGELGIEHRSYAHSHNGADYKAADLQPKAGAGYSFSAFHNDILLADIQLQVPGEHNVLNALGALAVADALGLDLREAAMALGDFRGTGRRFEERGEAGGVLIVDDYAHHPTEIRTTLAAARARYPQRRIWAIWQPHTFSRTQTLWPAFAAAFADADRVLVTDVYASREQRPNGFDMNALTAQIPAQHPAFFAANFADAKQILHSELASGDLLIIMSAGDAINLSAEIFAELQQKEQNDA
jgi:UDP-N-acetylmuramate--alanine ligase